MALTFDDVQKLIKPKMCGILATIDGDKPEARGWQLQKIEDGKFYFITSSKKAVIAQIEKNPNVVFTVSASGYNFRISGAAQLCKSEEEKAALHESMDKVLLQIYPTKDSNGFTYFTIDHGVIKYAKGFDPIPQSMEF